MTEETKTNIEENTNPLEEVSLVMIKEMISDLSKKFDDKIKTDNHKNKLFDNMHKELTDYNNGIVEKNLETFALDIIQLMDIYKKELSLLDSIESDDLNFLKAKETISNIIQDLEDVLYRQNIEPFIIESNEVDVKKQKIIEITETNNPELNNKIAKSKATGYEKNGKIIRPERISIYKFKEEKINE